MTEQELKEKYNLFTDAWKLYRKWAVQRFPLTDAQWEQVVREAHGICDKYGGTRMAEYMMIAVTQSLEDQERKLKKAIQNSGRNDNGRVNEED